jgi:hypothetical protein
LLNGLIEMMIKRNNIIMKYTVPNKRFNKVIMLQLFFLAIVICPNIICAQSVINGVYSAINGKSKTNLIIYEKNSEIFIKYQFIENVKKNKVVAQKIFKGYLIDINSEMRNIEINVSDEIFSKYNLGKLKITSRCHYKFSKSYDNLEPVPTYEKIVNFIDGRQNPTLQRDIDMSNLWQSFKIEVDSSTIELYGNKNYRTLTEELIYRFKDNEEWISDKKNGRQPQFLINHDNIEDTAKLKVLYDIGLSSSIDEAKDILEKWLNKNRKFWKFSYPNIHKIEFYLPANHEYISFNSYSPNQPNNETNNKENNAFTNSNHIITVLTNGYLKNFTIFKTELSKYEITLEEKGYSDRLIEIEKHFNRRSILENLFGIEDNIYKSKKDTYYYTDMKTRIEKIRKVIVPLKIAEYQKKLDNIDVKKRPEFVEWQSEFYEYVDRFLTYEEKQTPEYRILTKPLSDKKQIEDQKNDSYNKIENAKKVLINENYATMKILQRELRSKYVTNFPTFEDLFIILDKYTNLIGGFKKTFGEEFIAFVESLGYKRDILNSDEIFDIERFTNKNGFTITVSTDKTLNGTIITLEIAKASLEIKKLYYLDLVSNYRYSLNSTINPSIPQNNNLNSFIKNGGRIYGSDVNNDGLLKLKVYNNLNKRWPIVAERVDSNLIKISPYSNETDIFIKKGEIIHLLIETYPHGAIGTDNYRDDAFYLGFLKGQMPGENKWFYLLEKNSFKATQDGLLKLKFNDDRSTRKFDDFIVKYEIEK